MKAIWAERAVLPAASLLSTTIKYEVLAVSPVTFRLWAVILAALLTLKVVAAARSKGFVTPTYTLLVEASLVVHRAVRALLLTLKLIPEITGRVTSGGVGPVVNELCAERVLLPEASVDCTRKWYVVAEASPVRLRLWLVTKVLSNNARGLVLVTSTGLFVL